MLKLLLVYIGILILLVVMLTILLLFLEASYFKYNFS